MRNESGHGASARSMERLWLSAAELRLVAERLSATVVVVADIPIDLAETVKERRRRSARSGGTVGGQMTERATDRLGLRSRVCSAHGPVIYGSPEQVAVWIDSVRRLLVLEPDDVLGDVAVQRAVLQLAGFLVDRCGLGTELTNEAGPAR